MSTKKIFLHWRRTLILLGSLLTLVLPTFVLAEGTKEMSPTEDDWVLLQIREGFANYGTGGTVEGINFAVLDATEEVYFAFSGLGYGDYRLISNESYSFRVVDALGNVVHGPFVLNAANLNGKDYDEVVAGPDLGSGIGYDVSNPIFKFSPTSPGIYHLEFNLDNPNTGGFRNEGIVWWDISVIDSANEPKLGRLYSKNWWFRATTDGDPDIFNQPFEGKVYTLTDDGFVHLVDFENSGFRGLTFALAFNSTGPGDSGDLNLDRRSIPGLPTKPPEYDIFINDPDPNLYVEGTFGVVNYGPVLTSGAQCDTLGNDFCIEYEVDRPGLIEVILDLHQNDRIFTSGTRDKILIDRILVGGDLRGCVPWDLTDGLGDKVDPFTDLPIFIRYSQGEVHFMMNDVEYNNPGFTSTLIHPTGGSVADNVIFYDDSQLALEDQDNNLDLDNNILTGTNPPLVELNGCPMPCHIWNRLTNTSSQGYGESNTINSWWLQSSRPFPEFTSVTCQLDTLVLTKAVSKIKNAASGTNGNYDVTFEIIFENNGTTIFDSIQIIDDMAANFGAAYIDWIDGPNISSFNGNPTLPIGSTNPNLFDGVSGLMIPGDAIKVEFTVELNPEASGTLSILENQAIGQTTNNFSNTTTDLSDDILNPSSNDDPTPVRFPKIKLTKSVVDIPAPPAASQNPFSYDLTFEYLIENTGMVDLKNIRLEDDFIANYGGGFVQIVGFPSIGNNTSAQTPGEINKLYSGKDSNIGLLNKEGILKPGESIQVFVTAEIVLHQPDAIYNADGYFENTATTYGTATEISLFSKSTNNGKSGKPPLEIFDGVIVMDKSLVVFPREICSNGIDDDMDGLTDCDDPDCGFAVTIEISGDCTQLEVTSPESGWTYQWHKNSVIITGATSENLTPTGGGNYFVEVTNPQGCSIFSNTLTVADCCEPNNPAIIGLN